MHNGAKCLHLNFPAANLNHKLITAIEHLTDIEVLFFLMDKIGKQVWENLQILNKICDKNDKMLVDHFLKKIEEDQFCRLNKIKDQNGRSPYELLNETNKSIFEAVFSQ